MDILTSTTIPDISESSAIRARQLQQQIQGGDGVSDKQRLKAKKVSQDFEALMVGMMIKSMRATVGKDKLTGGGHGDEVYRSMLDQEYAAASVKRGGGLGLAKQIEKEIVRQESRRIHNSVDVHE
ncbi:MAG: rod-binding protein [Desulfuromonadaceae bacterium]|nr:rod-binding protein [Desulfuromonadaceae bacterium]